MRTILKLIYKDYLVLVRDVAGLAMLFIMPLALVFIMTSLQDTTFRAINENGIKMVILNGDADSLGHAIEREITGSKLFSVHREIDHMPPTEQTIREAVASGRFQVGMVIPEGVTRKIREQVRGNVSGLFSGDTLLKPVTDSQFINIYIDPATRSSLRSSLQGSIRQYTAQVESRIILNELTREVNKHMILPVHDLNLMKQETVFYREEYVARGDKKVLPNSVQHNVPAWTLFAMFFIVIPFATSMIKEREEGSFARLLTMPCSYNAILLSKVAVYLVVCYLQFIAIILMGIHLFPLCGLPALEMGGRFADLSVIAVAASLAAIGYGIAVGTLARTHQQAAIFASISVVILAAMGGIWVPLFMMPPFFRQISVISPLNWGLNGFYDILVRNATLAEVSGYLIPLVLFSLGCQLVALYYHRLRNEYI